MERFSHRGQPGNSPTTGAGTHKGLVPKRHKPFSYGATQRDRTADLRITSALLYQLS